MLTEELLLEKYFGDPVRWREDGEEVEYPGLVVHRKSQAREEEEEGQDEICGGE